MRLWAVPAFALLQIFLFSTHWFIYRTMSAFGGLKPPLDALLQVIFFFLSISFIAAATLATRYDNPAVAFFYKIAGLWLGFFNFLFWASCLCWIAFWAAKVAAPEAAMRARPQIAATLYGLALLACLYGLINARLIRERKVTVELPRLPAQWKGRTALLVTDVHLGNINGAGFARRIAVIARRLNASVIFFAGDLYDGSKVDPARVAAPLFELAPPLGVYFCGGNHEEFGDAAEYEKAIRDGGIRVLHNERVDVDGMQVIGVSFTGSNYPARLRAFLEELDLESGAASILLNHVPHRLPIVEQAGVSLQVSGHTHAGQIFPFTVATRWVYGKFTYGLQSFRRLKVLTSSGVGTWGPPMRVGTHPEVVLITFV